MTLSDLIKEKKETLNTNVAQGGSRFNHPNRMTDIRISGGIHLLSDPFTVTPLVPSPVVQEWNVDFSLLPMLERVLIENAPTRYGFSGTTIYPALGTEQFAMMHIPKNSWSFEDNTTMQITPSNVVVGTLVTTSYNSTGTSIVSVVTTNLTVRWKFLVEGGGYGWNGGVGPRDPRGGRDLETDDEKADGLIQIAFTGTKLPGPFQTTLEQEVKRFPWNDAWENTGIIFDDTVAAWIAAGSGRTGESNTMIEFSSSSGTNLDFSQDANNFNTILI